MNIHASFSVINLNIRVWRRVVIQKLAILFICGIMKMMKRLILAMDSPLTLIRYGISFHCFHIIYWNIFSFRTLAFLVSCCAQTVAFVEFVPQNCMKQIAFEMQPFSFDVQAEAMSACFVILFCDISLSATQNQPLHASQKTPGSIRGECSVLS